MLALQIHFLKIIKWKKKLTQFQTLSVHLSSPILAVEYSCTKGMKLNMTDINTIEFCSPISPVYLKDDWMININKHNLKESLEKRRNINSIPRPTLPWHGTCNSEVSSFEFDFQLSMGKNVTKIDFSKGNINLLDMGDRILNPRTMPYIWCAAHLHTCYNRNS